MRSGHDSLDANSEYSCFDPNLFLFSIRNRGVEASVFVAADSRCISVPEVVRSTLGVVVGKCTLVEVDNRRTLAVVDRGDAYLGLQVVFLRLGLIEVSLQWRLVDVLLYRWIVSD